MSALLFSSLGMAGACGGDEGEASPDSGTIGADAGTDTDATPGSADWQLLIDGSWEIPAGTEFYKCARVTLSEDTYISDFKAIGPAGTHHTVLTVGDPDGPDGITTCSAGENHPTMIFGSGIGPAEFNFPEGVGVKIPAGQQLLLNLHLFNVSESVLTGTSATEVKLTSADKVIHEAESVLAGSVQISIPAGQTVDIVGRCTAEQDITILSVAPHMHQIGTHMKIEALRADGDMMLSDEPYDFRDQKLYQLEPISMKQGDQIKVTCTYNNTTDQTVGFGDSSNSEMCFGGFYRYPKRPTTPFGIVCLN
ncbi:MAG: hypothetical protein JKY56_13425 [Kofleriaceae bacterium]|nr:hypothetical protein [Kofleriaceae bacterium]